MEDNRIRIIFENWKSPYVSRLQIFEITGGMISAKTLRNLDAKGEGIPGKLRVSARRVVYPVENVIAWLEKGVKRWDKNKKDPVT